MAGEELEGPEGESGGGETEDKGGLWLKVDEMNRYMRDRHPKVQGTQRIQGRQVRGWRRGVWAGTEVDCDMRGRHPRVVQPGGGKGRQVRGGRGWGLKVVEMDCHMRDRHLRGCNGSTGWQVRS